MLLQEDEHYKKRAQNYFHTVHAEVALAASYYLCSGNDEVILGGEKMVEMICVLFKINNFFPLLIVGSPYARSTVVTAIKFTISDHPQTIDPLLKGCIGNFEF